MPHHAGRPMPPERIDEPSLEQVVESLQSQLRAEERAREQLREQSDHLQNRCRTLEAERTRLQQELKSLRTSAPHRPSVLPDPLSPPFEVRPRWFLAVRGHELWWWYVMFVAVMALLMHGLMRWSGAVFFVFYLVQLFFVHLVIMWKWWAEWRRHPWWGFKEKGIAVQGESWKPLLEVPYTRMLRVDAQVSPVQVARGLGDVVVWWTAPGKTQPEEVRLKNAPEPERLAKWLETRRKDKV
jgi:membrane protein YdbS with pleckstrin-like domain